MKSFLGLIAWIFLAGMLLAAPSCASITGNTPAALFDKQLATYNALTETLVAARTPCVQIGPEAPGCLIDNATYRRVELVRPATWGYLTSAKQALDAGETKEAKILMHSVAGGLIALASYAPDEAGD